MSGQLGIDMQTVISVLQTALTPAFLLVALGSLLNVLTGRLSRIVDRSRELQEKHRRVQGVRRSSVSRQRVAGRRANPASYVSAERRGRAQ